jgi:DNA-binding transcriptional regulator YhcF (GntR family)
VGLAIKPNIVERVYRDLEKEGILNFEEGTGIFVAYPVRAQISAPSASDGQIPARSASDRRKPKLRELCKQFAAKASQLGYSLDEVIDELAAPNMRRQS